MVETNIPQNAVVLIPAHDLLQEIDNRFEKRINEKKELELQAQLLSPKKTCRLFDPAISLVTLNSWVKKGYLVDYRIGGRVYFKYSEVLEAVKNLKKYSRK